MEVTSYNDSISSIVHNSTLKATASFNVSPLQPSTVYNISVIPCNMAGCNESCDVYSVRTESETGIEGEEAECTLTVLLYLAMTVEHV